MASYEITKDGKTFQIDSPKELSDEELQSYAGGEPPQPSLLQRAGQAAKSIGSGILKVVNWKPKAAQNLVDKVTPELMAKMGASTEPKMQIRSPNNVGFENLPIPLQQKMGMRQQPDTSYTTQANELAIPAHMAADMALTPSTYAGVVGKIPWLAGVFGKAAKGVETGVTGLEAGLTGKTFGTLKTASTSEGAKAIQAAAETEPQIARKLVDIADNSREHIAPDLAAVRDAESNAGNVDLRDVLKAFDEAKAKSAGPMGANTELGLKVNARLDKEAAALRGNLPSEAEIAKMDFGGNLEEARAALADPESKWGTLKKIADQSGNASKTAQAKLASATSKAAQAGKKAGKAQALASGDSPYTSLYNFQDDADKAMAEAKALSDKAKTAYVEAQGKMAAGEITAQDADRARAEFEHAQKNFQIADATNEFSKGLTIDEIGKSMVTRHKVSGAELQDVLKRGRDNVAQNSFTPNYEISVEDLRRLKTSLGQSTKFDAPEAKAVNTAMQSVYGKIKDLIVNKVGETKGAEAGAKYAQDLDKVTQKISDFKELNSRLGRLDSKRLDNALSMVKNSSESQKTGTADLLKNIDVHAGTDIHPQSEYARMAREFTPVNKREEALNPANAGKPSWKPAGGGVALGEGALGAIMHSAGLPPWAIAAVEAPLVAGSIPAVATKIAIPLSRGLPKLAGKALQAGPAISATGAAINQANQPSPQAPTVLDTLMRAPQSRDAPQSREITLPEVNVQRGTIAPQEAPRPSTGSSRLDNVISTLQTIKPSQRARFAPILMALITQTPDAVGGRAKPPFTASGD